MNGISLNIFGRNIVLNYNDISLLRKYAPLQMGENNFPKDLTDEEFIKKISTFIKYNFERSAKYIGQNHSIKKVIDVGSGMSLFDIILYKLSSTETQGPNVYLVDKSERIGGHATPYVKDENQHGFYNSWDCAIDVIKASNIPLDDFNFLSPEDSWPDDVDIIVSQYSWLWHYPSKTYLERAYNSLRPGGKLIVDVMYLKEKDQAEEISELFKSKPIGFHETGAVINDENYVHPFFKKPMKELYHIINGRHGMTCCWVK